MSKNPLWHIVPTESKNGASQKPANKSILSHLMPNTGTNNPYAIGAGSLESTFNSRFNEGLIAGYNPDSVRRGNQKWYDLLGSAALNTTAEIGLGALEGIGYLADIPQWRNIMAQTETEFGNWFSDYMKQAKEYIKSDIAPIYTDQRDEGFQPINPRWWMVNAPSIGSALSLMIPTLGAVKGLSAVGKGLVGTKLLAKANPALTGAIKGVTAATISRYMEGTMEASGTFEETYKAALEAGKNDIQAKEIAGEAAAGTFNKNLALLAFDVFQYNKLFKTFDAANASRLVKNKLVKDLGKQAGSEGLEEAFQYIASKESSREALVNAKALKDDRTFSKRLIDYTKDSDLWTSAFFGAFGGGVFGGIAEYRANKPKEKRNIIGDMIKPTAEFEQAVFQGDKTKAQYLEDEAFIDYVNAQANNGTLFKAKQHLEDWGKGVLELSDEEAIKQGYDKSNIQNILDVRLKDVQKAEEIYNNISKENLSDDLKTAKFKIALGKELSARHKFESNKEVENIISQITLDNKLAPEVAELKRNIALRNAYLDAKSIELANVYNDSIKKLTDQIKQLYPSLNIKEALVSDKTDQLASAANDYVRHESNELELDRELSKFKDENSRNEIQTIIDTAKKASDEEKFKEIQAALNPNISSSDLNGLARSAKNIGKETEFEGIKNSFIEKLQRESGFVDLNDLNNSLKNRYNNNNLLFDIETKELGKRLNSVSLDEDVIEQKFNSNPKNREIITDYYNNLNAKVNDNLKNNTPETPYENPESNTQEEQTVNDATNNVDTRRPFMSVGEQFSFKKTETGWITEYENGNPKPSTKENLVNWDEVNKPEFANSGTTVHYEFDPNSKYNQKIKNDSNVVNQREIQIVVYKDGNHLNKVYNNRIIIGTLPAYNSNTSWSNVDEATSLKALREAIDKKIKESVVGTNTISLGITSKVQEKLAGRVHSTNVINAPHQILKPNEKLLFGIVRIANQVPYLDVPGLPLGSVDVTNLVPGATYLIIPAANNKLTGVRLFTKKLKDLPEQLAQAKTVVSSIKSQEDWLTFGYKNLTDIVGFPKDHIAYNNGVVAFLNGQWTSLSNVEALGDLIAQVDINYINKGEYNLNVSKAGILTTKLNPNNHFHSAKFLISPNWTIDTNVQQNPINIVSETPSITNKPASKTIGNLDVPSLGTFNIGTNSKFKVFIGEEYTKWNKQQETVWWNKNLSKVPLNVLDNIHEIYRKGGYKTFGIFKDASAFIWTNAGTGTAYHEAFHAVFNLYHTDEQRRKLLDEASQYFNIPRNMELKIEEELADYFSEYVQSREASRESLPATIANRVRNFFKELYMLLKSMFTDNVTIDELMYRINDSYYTDKEFTVKNNSYWNNTETRFKLFIDPRVKQHYTRMINTQFFKAIEYVRENYEGYNGLSDIEVINKWGKDNDMNGVTAMYASVYKQLYNLYYDESTSDEIREALVNDNNDGILNNFFTVKDGKITSVGDYVVTAAIDLANYGINVDISKKSIEKTADSPVDEKEFELVEDDNNYEGWELKSLSISGKETMSYEVKKLLRQTIEVTKNQEGKIEPITDSIFNRPIFVNFDELYNYLERNLADIYDEPSMIQRLKYLEQFKPSLFSISTKLEEDSKLRSQFFSNFAKAHVKYTSVKQYAYTKIEDGELVTDYTWRILNSNRGDIRRVITNDWFSNFNSDKRNSVIDSKGNIKKDIGNKLYNDFKQVVDRIKSTRQFSDNDVLTIHKSLFDIGLDISPEELKSAYQESTVKLDNIKTTVPAINNFINLLSGIPNSIENIFIRIKNGENPFQELTGEFNAINNLIETKLFYSNDLIQSAFRNVENKNVYSHQNPTYLSRMISDLKTGKYQALHLQDRYYQRNLWLKELQSDPTLSIEYTYIDGLIYDNKDKGTKYTKMSPKDFETTSLNMWLGSENNGVPSKFGYYKLPVLADSPTLAFLKFKKYNHTEIVDALYQVALQEYERIESSKIEKTKEGGIKNYKDSQNYIFLPFLNNNNIDVNDENRVKGEIDKWLSEEFEREYNELKEIKVINANTLEGNVSNKAISYYGNDSRNLLKHYFENQVLANIQIFQLLHGDPSFYKSSDLYAGKRNNQVTKPGIKLNTAVIRPIYNSVYVNDIIKDSSKSYFGEYLNKALDNLSKGEKQNILSQYADVNATDAQSFITLDRYREIQIGLGRWTFAMEEAYPRLKAGKALSKDINLVLQPIKPFYFDHLLINGKIVPTQNKNSEAVLLPQLVNKSEKLKALLNYMEKNQIDSVQFVSAVKTGQYGEVDIDQMIDNKATPVIHKLSNDAYVIQQEVPEHHLDDQNIYGTQIRKLILADIDLKKEYLQGLNGEQLVSLYNRIISYNVEESYNEVASRFDDLESISKLITEEVRDRKLGENFEELAGLTYDNDGKASFKYPLYFPTQAKRVESLLTSIFKNKVTKQKINGGSFVLVSNFGFEDDLKIVFNEKENSIDYMEVIMPWWSDKFTPLLPNGEIDMSKIDRKLLDAIGYRIPTEGKYSIKRIKVKKFSPKEAGGIVILPSEITKISGEDFDIDKLFIMLPEFEIKGNRAIKVDYDYTKSPEEQSLAARNNALIDITASIWSSSTSFKDTVEPGGFDNLKALRAAISYSDNSSISLPSQQRSIFNRNMTGAGLIGIFANHNVSHAVSQNFPLSLKGQIKFDGKKFSNINKKLDTNKRLISRNLASLVAASVDNAKDPILNDLNINSYTADILTTILRSGHSMETAIYFLNQPIIREFMSAYTNSTGYNKEFEIFNDLINQYSKDINIELTPNKTYNLSTKNMRLYSTGLFSSQNGKYFNETQVKALHNFMEYKKLANNLANYVSLTRPDAKGTGKSITNNTIYLNRFNKAREFEPINGFNNVYDPASNYSIIRSFHEYGINRPNNLLSRYFPYNNVWFRAINNSLEFLKQRELTEQEIEHINSETFRYYLSEFFGNTDKLDVINNLPDRVLSYQTKNRNLKQYQFIANLKVEQPTDSIPYKRLSFSNNVSLTNEQKNYMMDSLEYMALNGTTEEKQLANDLIKYNFFTSGFQFSSNTFGHLIPHSYLRILKNNKGESYIDFINRIQEQSKDLEGASEFIDQYIRNFYKVSDIVKNIRSSSNSLSGFIETSKGNLTSFKIDPAKDIKREAFIGYESDENKTPIYKDYVSLTHRGKTRLYKFAGLSGNEGVYNLVSDLGISQFAAEYSKDQGITSDFNENKLPTLEPELFFEVDTRTVDTVSNEVYKPDYNDTQDTINKCQ